MAQNTNLSHLDAHQIINRVFNPDDDTIRVEANVSIGSTEVIVSHTDDSIKIGDGTDLVTTTTVGADVGLDVNVVGGVVSGEFTSSGLKTAGKITTMNVSDTAIPLPAVALVNRNSLSLTNLSSTDTLYVGFDTSITADRTIGITAGWEVGPNEGFNLDVTDDIVIYGITETGVTVKIKIMELA